MANEAVKSKVGKQNVEFSTFNSRRRIDLHRIITLYTVLLQKKCIFTLTKYWCVIYFQFTYICIDMTHI